MTDLLIQSLLLNAPDPNEPLPLSNQPATIYGITLTFLVVSCFFVALRLWVRFRVIHDPGWDDFLVVLACMCNITATAVLLRGIKYGLGRHYLYIGLETMVTYQKHFYVMNAVYVTETAIIKMSLLVQYLRVFKAGSMRWICLSLLGIITAWGFTYGFLTWVPCFPIQAFWDRFKYPNAKCYGFGFDFNKMNDFVGLFVSHTALNMVFDFTIFITPMVLFTTPKLKRKNIFALGGILAFGSIVVMISVWRLYTIIETQAATKPYLDFTWWAPKPLILSCLEIDLAIMVASMPVFWPVVESSFTAIFVTHEVQITEHRRLEDEDDVYELKEGKDGKRKNSLKSNSGNSQEELTKQSSDERKLDGVGDHYKDPYNIAQVDPFGIEASAGVIGVATNVDSTTEKPKWKGYQ
ncbi:hypothetical protein DM02DRAFT_562695 [Periconia macrospinosa]|uniref:Rhodopsin domain-containing protein n=1 Tax=Periconia macrospinosa TaxID=97972 RepID=A0A2V1DQQ6_9PLEO|nr:hypothetical protein DM02DRAFT_562695 [Periconia macrospinosa]